MSRSRSSRAAIARMSSVSSGALPCDATPNVRRIPRQISRTGFAPVGESCPACWWACEIDVRWPLQSGDGEPACPVGQVERHRGGIGRERIEAAGLAPAGELPPVGPVGPQRGRGFRRLPVGAGGVGEAIEVGADLRESDDLGGGHRSHSPSRRTNSSRRSADR